MSTAAAISVQSSVDGSVWYPLFHPTQNSSTVGTQLAVISASVGSGGGFTPLPAGGLKYVRFIAGAVISGGVSFKLVCSN